MWAIIFGVVSFVFANLGLSAIIEYSIPVLMFLYPLAIVLIILALFGKLFDNNRAVYVSTIAFTFVSAFYDLLNNLPDNVKGTLGLNAPLKAVAKVLPLSDIGLSWVCPAAIGLVIGLAIYLVNTKIRKKNIA